MSPKVLTYFESASNDRSSPANVASDDLQKKLNLAKILVERDPPVKPHSTMFGDDSELKANFASVLKLSASSNSPAPTSPCVQLKRTPYNATFKIEEYIRVSAYSFFLEHGRLVQQSDLQVVDAESGAGLMVTDEEYLGGVISFINTDLSRYVTGRAIERDYQSVGLAKKLVTELFEVLSEFDFRNGPIRRKFDGVKYCVRRVENVIYEMSITERGGDGGDDMEDGEPAMKKVKTEVVVDDSRLIDTAPFKSMQSRFEQYDAKREVVIKRSREIQKSAKNAIFALHRNDLKKAGSLIEVCETVGAEILAVLDGDETMPKAGLESLRQGAFSNSLEEYAEAMLFKVWMDTGLVEEFDGIKMIDAEEYVGGLGDLSGEVGRVAVIHGTKRSEKGVQQCLDTNMSILCALDNVQLPGKISKKMEPLRQSVQKLETVLYELSLIKAKGGGVVSMSSGDAPPASGGDDE